MASFKELLQASFKSNDTEEWLDVYFTRPIGLLFALMWIKVGVTPNFVTILSMFLGAGAGFCFVHTDLWWNVGGVVLMMLANFCDSTDGQMARLTNHKTLVGRMLDGFASDVWFFCCYLAIVIRIWNDPIPFTSVRWGVWGLLLCAYAGFHWHARQCQLADYYRQIHLYFIKGESGSELATSVAQEHIVSNIPRHRVGPFLVPVRDRFWEYLFFYFYGGWCKKQEKTTPQFQQFFARLKSLYPSAADMPSSFREQFRQGSLPLMKYTNILTHNTRAIVMFAACLLNVPYVYPLFEITVLAAIYYYMHYRHERLCKSLISKS